MNLRLFERSMLHHRKTLLNRQRGSGEEVDPRPGGSGTSSSPPPTFSIPFSRTVGNGGTTTTTTPGQTTTRETTTTTPTRTTETETATTTTQRTTEGDTNTNTATTRNTATSPDTTTTTTGPTPTQTPTANTVANHGPNTDTLTRTTTGPPRGVVTTVTGSETITAPTISNSSESDSGGSTNTGAIVGGIAGAFVGIAVLGFVIMFLLKRWRRKTAEEDAFNATNFRRSAVMLDDPPADMPPPMAGNNRNPRPPTMIERHVHHSPALANYQYTEQAPYPSPGPAGYPAYNSEPAYGAPMAGYGYGYPEQEQYHPYQSPQQPYSPYGPGQVVPPSHTMSPPPPEHGLPNPFMASQEPLPPPSPMGDNARGPGTPVGADPHTASYVKRQSSPTMGMAAPDYNGMDNNGQYVEMARDVKGPIPDDTPATPAASGSAPAAPATPSSPTVPSALTPGANRRPTLPSADQARPVSTHTVYDLDDAYGGM